MTDLAARPRPVTRPTTGPGPTLAWALAGAAVLAQVAYPLVGGDPARAGDARDLLTIATVLLFAAAVITHAVVTQGIRTATFLLFLVGGVGFAAEALGTATGVPFGAYAYAGSLGPRLLGVPLVVPLAWVMMSWPAYAVAARLCTGRAARAAVTALALASWDLFLDPQMVAAGHWRWLNVSHTLPGVPGVPLSNYLGWLGVAAVIGSLLVVAVPRPPQGPLPVALWLWTWFGSTLANAAFFGRPAVAVWGGAAMAVVGVPLLRRLAR